MSSRSKLRLLHYDYLVFRRYQTAKSLGSQNEAAPLRPDNSKWYVDNSSRAVLARGWTKFMDKTKNFITVYEELIGMTQVKEAHTRVLQAEQKFLEAQEIRRAIQLNLAELQKQLRGIQTELDGMPRGRNPKYIELAQQEFDLLRTEEELQSQFKDKEKLERDTFHELSRALRFSHEKERAQNEKTKYWSIMGSLIGACIGIIGSTINSSLRMRQLKRLIVESQAANGNTQAGSPHQSFQYSSSSNASSNVPSMSGSFSNGIVGYGFLPSMSATQIMDFSKQLSEDVERKSKNLFVSHVCPKCEENTHQESFAPEFDLSPSSIQKMEQLVNQQQQTLQQYLVSYIGISILLVLLARYS